VERRIHKPGASCNHAVSLRAPIANHSSAVNNSPSMTHAPSVTVFVNERPTLVPAPATVLRAVEARDEALLQQLRAGKAYVTDGRGIRLQGDTTLEAGAILRVVVSARRQES